MSLMSFFNSGISWVFFCRKLTYVYVIYPSIYTCLSILKWVSEFGDEMFGFWWLSFFRVGSSGEEDRFGSSDFQAKNVEWEDQILNPSQRIPAVDVKQEVVSQSSHPYNHGDEGFQTSRPPWSQIMPVSSPRSCVTNLSTNILDFSNKAGVRNQHADHSTEVWEEKEKESQKGKLSFMS